MNIALFLESLKIMGTGMFGIFSVTIVLVVIMEALTRLFPDKGNDE